MRTQIKAILYLTVLSVMGCSSPYLNSPNSSLSRDVTQQLDLNHWDLRSQISVNNGENAWSAQVYWRQRGEHFVIRIFGPFAGGSMKIVGYPGQVMLSSTSNHQATAASIDELFAQQTGWQLPLADMVYWIKAIPVPNKPALKQLDHHSQLVVLTQAGWKITYSGYHSVQGIPLPTKLQLIQEPLRVKIVGITWKLG